MNWRGRYIPWVLGVLLVLIGRVVSADADEPLMFYAEDIKAAMQVHLEKTLDEDGVFHLVDDVTGEALKLTFMQVHDPVRQMDGDVYFACTDFHPIGEGIEFTTSTFG